MIYGYFLLHISSCFLNQCVIGHSYFIFLYCKHSYCVWWSILYSYTVETFSKIYFLNKLNGMCNFYYLCNHYIFIIFMVIIIFLCLIFCRNLVPTKFKPIEYWCAKLLEISCHLHWGCNWEFWIWRYPLPAKDPVA